MRRPSSSRTPSNHGFISRCTAPARPFPECINGLGCKLYRPRGEIPIREPFRSVYRWISNSVVRTPLTVLRTALRFNGKSRKTIGGIDSIHFVFLPFLSSSFIIFFSLFSFFFSIIRIFGSKFLFAMFVSCESFLVGEVFVYFWKGAKGNEKRVEKNISSIVWWNKTYFYNWNICLYILKEKSFVRGDAKGCNALIYCQEFN